MIFTGYDPIYESVQILAGDVSELGVVERRRVLDDARLTLEDSSSPVTRKYQEKLFEAVVKKDHIKFGGIESSQGDISQYSGYGSMVEVLDTIGKLADEQNATNVKECVSTVQTALNYIKGLSATYQRGFQVKCEYVMMEYNIYAYTVVQATSALLYEFVDYVKRPDKTTMTIQLRDSKARANLFYFQQLEKFNKVQKNMGMDYRKMLESAINKGKNNFIGSDMAIGYAALSLVALAIVQVSREFAYKYYNLRKNVSNELELQASFLEMNRLSVENNDNMDQVRKTKVLEKQKKLADKLHKLSSKLRVESVTATKKTKKDIATDNKELTGPKVREDVEKSPIMLKSADSSGVSIF